MTSNAMFEMPVYMRFYFVYGTLLLPIAFVFAIMRCTGSSWSARTAPFFAPLIEGPIVNPVSGWPLIPYI
jgi:hypothetical protein